MRPRQEQRIRNEEELRARLQAGMPNRKASLRLWTFVNSAFGIWVLSTVVLGTFSWMYAQWQFLHNNAQEIQKLDIEVDARLSGLEYQLISYKPSPEKASSHPVNVLLLPPGASNAIHPEFANRNLKSLLYDLRARVPVSEQFGLVDVLMELKGLEGTLDKQMNLEESLNFQMVVHDIRERRWGWAMANRDYDAYESPLQLLPYWLPSYLAKAIIVAAAVWITFLGYRWARRSRKTS